MNFIEAKLRHCACIYCIVLPNGMRYIGQTKDLGKRLSLYEKNVSGEFKNDSTIVRALRDADLSNVSFEVLCEVSGLSREDELLCLSILEIKYIRELNTISPNGYNVSAGGELLNIPIECISTNSISPYQGTCKPVLCYELTGKFLKEFDSIEKCAYNFGVDANCVRSALDKRGALFMDSYMLRLKRYNTIPDSIIPFKPEYIPKVVTKTTYEEKIVVRERVVAKPRGSILKYNIAGEFCGEYEMLVDAAMSIGLRSVAKGIIRKGYLFLEHDGGEIQQNIGELKKKDKRVPKYSDYIQSGDENTISGSSNRGWSNLINDFKVGQYNLDGDLITVHNSIKEASYNTGIGYSSIWSCIFGRTRRGRGFIWRKIE